MAWFHHNVQLNQCTLVLQGYVSHLIFYATQFMFCLRDCSSERKPVACASQEEGNAHQSRTCFTLAGRFFQTGLSQFLRDIRHHQSCEKPQAQPWVEGNDLLARQSTAQPTGESGMKGKDGFQSTRQALSKSNVSTNQNILLTSECCPAPMWTPTKPGLAEPCSMLVALREVAGSSTTGPPPYWAAAAAGAETARPGRGRWCGGGALPAADSHTHGSHPPTPQHTCNLHHRGSDRGHQALCTIRGNLHNCAPEHRASSPYAFCFFVTFFGLPGKNLH